MEGHEDKKITFNIFFMKPIFLFVFSILCVSAFAQKKTVVAGFDYSSFSVSYADFKPGFYVGGKYDLWKLNSSREHVFQTGLVFSTGGCKYDIFGLYSKFDINTYSIEVPADFVFRFNSEKTIPFELVSGLYFKYGLFGSRVIESESENSNINPFSIYNRFDMGLNLGLGFHWQNWLLQCGYQHGFMSVEKSNANIQNIKLRLGLGYKF
jgi:hypothetical protein